MARPQPLPRRLRLDRCGFALWRRHDHAGDLGVERRRGAQAREPGFRPLHDADRRDHPVAAVRGPALRHLRRRPRLRAGDAAVVFDNRDPGRDRHRQGAPRHRRGQSALCGGVPDPPWRRELRHPRCGVSLRDRRRSHVRRHGPSRPRADPDRLDGHRLAGAASQLCRPNRRCAAKLRRRRQSVFRAGARLAALSDDRSLHAGDRHRQPGHHHRLVLADPAGDAARLAAGDAHQSDVVGTVRPDLRAVRELADDARHAGADGDFREARIGLPAPTARRCPPPC